MAFGRHQAHLRARALDNGIGNECRAVHQAVNIAGIGFGFPQQPSDALHYGGAWVVRRGQLLAGKNQIAIFIDQYKIREGAPDIDTNANTTRHQLTP